VDDRRVADKGEETGEQDESIRPATSPMAPAAAASGRSQAMLRRMLSAGGCWQIC
jgi:hypothetical protein